MKNYYSNMVSTIRMKVKRIDRKLKKVYNMFSPQKDDLMYMKQDVLMALIRFRFKNVSSKLDEIINMIHDLEKRQIELKILLNL